VSTHRLTPKQLLEQAGTYQPDVIAVRVGGELVDLHTPVDAAAKLEPVRYMDEEALEVIRHSTAHVMADAVQRLFPGTQVTIGPAIDQGFYYDFDRPDGPFTDADLARIEEKMAEIIAADFPFRRDVVSLDEARALFERMGERYKLELLQRAEGEISLYRHGDWVDLCKGPHVPSTRFLGAVKLTSVAGAYWRGDERNPMLQRIYGTAFPTQEQLDRHIAQMEEAKKRDHRKLGKELELVAFHPWAPASPFFLPRGATVYNLLIQYIRDLYGRYGYVEAITPQIFDVELFRVSGHLASYKEAMFFATTAQEASDEVGERGKGASDEVGERGKGASDEVGERDKGASDEVGERGKGASDEVDAPSRFGVKPMNCPGHALMFAMQRRSYKELPYRLADFGRLHRYERSGVTQGLTRVRTFCQDDAHVFCTLDQVQQEIVSFIRLVLNVYEDFGFHDVRIVVATRPENRLGTEAMWDEAERALLQAVQAQQLPFVVAEGEGAFYGPKIEFHLKDALGRSWQLGTMQVDFNLPERFDLEYIGHDNTSHRPVMLHRAILGSIERFFGVLLEHVGGAFPAWIAPFQVCLLTVSEKFNDYAREVQRQLERAGVRVAGDFSDAKLGAKMRTAHGYRYPYLAVIGQKEKDSLGMGVRSRDEQKDLGLMSVDEFIRRVKVESVPPSLRDQATTKGDRPFQQEE
jgi:threonyl-tRNA synthetase